MTMKQPRGEHKQLLEWWKEHGGGTLYREVPLAARAWEHRPWGASSPRRFDGVVVSGGPADVRTGQQFRSDAQSGSLCGRTCKLIEVKSALNEGVVGQALVGRWLFEQQVAGPERHGLAIEQTVVMYQHEDPAMKWALEGLGLTAIRTGIPARNLGTMLRYTGELHDLHIPPLRSFRAKYGGRFLAQIPVAGADCGVPEWAGSVQVRVGVLWRPGPASGIEVCEGREHLQEWTDGHAVELLVVNDSRSLMRGQFGRAECGRRMLQRQYGLPSLPVRVLASQRDAALAAAYAALGQGWLQVEPIA